MKKLDPKAIWLFFIQYVVGFFFTIFFLVFCFGFYGLNILLDGFTFNNSFDGGAAIFLICAAVVVPFLIIIVLSYVFAVLTYNNYKYELRDNGFYKESGVITKRYVSIPYERIQNIDIVRGLISRILGLSDIQIQTAGMSISYGRNGAMGANSEGRLPALSKEDADFIRDELLKRAKDERKSQGV